jgi:PAS domain S-box-containing protein
LSGDARATEILDFSGDEMTAGDFFERIHPNDAERVSMRFMDALDAVRPERTVTEFRYRLRHGGFRWLEALALTHFEGAGPERRAVSVVGTVADVTARKEMEEENRARAQKEHLIMREMHHRAKNMLSVVDAIAHQTASRSPEDFVARFSERIQALSANQDLLVRSDWKGVEIKGLVQAQLAHFADLIGPRITVDGPTLCLTAASAQAVGLAIHELATNAGKYGALATDKGRVDIRWGIDDDTFSISWTEREGPPVSAPTRRGFGSIVMGVMAERSVGGTVDVDYPPTGVTWRLTCPAANALEPFEIATLKREQVSPGRMSA